MYANEVSIYGRVSWYIIRQCPYMVKKHKYMQMRVIIDGIKPPTTIYGKDMLIYAN